MFSPSQSRGFDQRHCTRNNYSIPPISEDHLQLWLQNSPKCSSIFMEEDDQYFSDFQSEKSNRNTDNSCLEDILLHGYDNAKTQSSNNMQTRKSHGGKEGFEGGEECKRQKRPRSTEVHKLNERLRRKKLTEKMTALQEIIPNSVKRGQATTIDDAIKYIKSLQCLVQVLSREASHTLLHSTGGMLLHGQQGFQIPNLIPFPQTRLCGNGMYSGMSIGYPVGLPTPWLFPSSAASPGLQSAQNNLGQFMEPIYADSNISCFGIPPSSIVANKETSQSQGATSALIE